MGISNSSPAASPGNSSHVDPGSNDDITGGKLVIYILVLTILSFMALVTIRCLVEYRKHRKAVQKVKKQQQRISNRISRKQSFKEELETAVRIRKERLELELGSDDSDNFETTVGLVQDLSYNIGSPTYSRPPSNDEGIISDLDQDAIEVAPPLETAV